MSSQFIVINEIEELLNEMNDGLTGSIGTINSTVNTINTNMAKQTDLTTVKTNTAANNTESSTGTLSQKLAYLINRRDRIVTSSNANIKTLISNNDISLVANESPSEDIFSFYFGYSGEYKLLITYSGSLNYISGAGTKPQADLNVAIESVEGNQLVKTINIATFSNSNVSINKTTKEICLFGSRGSKVSANFSIKNGSTYINGSYYYSTLNINIESAKVCGTLNEVKSAII